MTIKRKFLKTSAILGLLIGLMLIGSGCSCGGGGSSNTEVTLKYWRPLDDEEVFKPIFEDLNNDYKNYKIEYTKKDAAEYYQNLLDALASDNGPDIFAIRNDWLPDFKDKIEFVPDNIYSKEEFQNTFVDAASNELVKEEGIYGIPISVDSLSMIYNDRMLASAKCQRPPQNWNQFISCSEKITSLNGSYVKTAGTALGTTSNLLPDAQDSKKLASDILSTMMIQSGTEMVSADLSSASFGLPIQKASGGSVYPGTSALSFYTSFAQTKKETYSWNNGMDNAVKTFLNQKAAMIFGYSDLAKAIYDKNPKFVYKSAAIPQIKDSETPKTMASFWIEVVSKRSTHKTEAWNTLKFLSTTKEINKYCSATKKPPSRKDMISAYSGTGQFGAFAKQLEYATTWYKGKQPDKVYTIFANMINGVLKGQKPQNAIDSARNSVTALFQAQK